MKKTIFLVCAMAASTTAWSSQTSGWGYSGSNGPENWASLSGDNFACSDKNQSPVNLTGFIEADLTPINFSYLSGGYEILNNGHTVQVNYKKGSSITMDDEKFDLLQFHFHAPSENQINGKSFSLEAHLVHSDSKGNLAVVAVMLEAGDENNEITSAWKSMPANAGDKYTLDNAFSVSGILPENREYYRFNGSLTTPPCSEGVRWFVMKQAVTASNEQINAFKQVLKEANNRPLQDLNARIVLK